MGLDARVRILRDGLQACFPRRGGWRGSYYQKECCNQREIEPEGAFRFGKGRARILRRRPLLPTFKGPPCKASSRTQRCNVPSLLLLSPYPRVHCFVFITGSVTPPHTCRPHSEALRMSSPSTTKKIVRSVCL